MKFVVSTDAGCDLGLDYVKENDVKVISMKFMIDDGTGVKEYVFGNGEAGLSSKEFYELVRKGKQAKTSLINEEEHLVYFKKLFSEGAKNILHIPLSSGLSGTCVNAVAAAEKLNQENKDKKIVVVDFLGASMGQGLVVDYLVRLRNEGKTLEEAAAFVEENKLRFCHYFTVDDLGHLRRGGRVSGFAAFIGSILKIKPVLHVSNEGKLIPVEKKIGRKKALLGLLEKIKELRDATEQRVFISHADSLEDAQSLASMIKEECGINDIVLGDIGPIIGAHAGPGTIAMFFVGQHR